MRNAMLVLVAVFLLVSVAGADQSVDETRAASPTGRVEIELVSGRVDVIGWDRSEVRVTGTIDDESERLDISDEDGGIEIEIDLIGSGRSRKQPGAQLEIHVPRGSSVEVETVSAPVTIGDVVGSLSVESVSGSVEVRRAARIDEIATVSGNISVEGGRELEGGEFESVSGSVRLDGSLSSRGRFSIEVVSGDIEISLPENASAQFEIETFSGKIKSDFGPSAGRADRHEPGQELNFSVGSGAARFSIETFSGGVSVKKRD